MKRKNSLECAGLDGALDSIAVNRPTQSGVALRLPPHSKSICGSFIPMYTLKVRSQQREELVEFTDEVQRQLTESGAKEGVVVLYVQHTTAGLTVNENADPDVPRDMLHALRTLIPQH